MTNYLVKSFEDFSKFLSHLATAIKVEGREPWSDRNLRVMFTPKNYPCVIVYSFCEYKGALGLNIAHVYPEDFNRPKSGDTLFSDPIWKKYQAAAHATLPKL